MRLKFYGGKRFEEFTETIIERINSEILNNTEDYILQVSTDEYAAYLEDNYKIDTPELQFDDVSADSTEREISTSEFPRFDFHFIQEGKHRVQVINYYIPYEGDIDILQYRPNPYSMVAFELKVDSSKKFVLIDVINFYNDPNRVKSAYDQCIRDIHSNYSRLIESCQLFNNQLLNRIKGIIDNRKAQFLKKSDFLSSLGVPIKKRDNVSETFSIPKPKLREKIIITKPVVDKKGFRPEPKLDDENHKRILKLINDMGKNLQRMPSTYKGKGEEDLRDYILLILDPNFELGSATGETFNKEGKTDICLSYGGGVVFIAECKIWKGEKGFLKTIDQLLNYLTWRDSKVAVINFVQNAEFFEILKKIKTTISTHPNFLSHLGDSEDAWFNYKFHLNGDRNRVIDLAVISFHLPKV